MEYRVIQAPDIATLFYGFTQVRGLVVCVSGCGPAPQPNQAVLSYTVASSHTLPYMTNKSGLYHSWADLSCSSATFGRLTSNKASTVLSQVVQQAVRVTLKGRETTCVGHALYFCWMRLPSRNWKGEAALRSVLRGPSCLPVRLEVAAAPAARSSGDGGGLSPAQTIH